MRYDHSKEEAAEFLRMTLKFLGQYDLPANPANYAVWYEYVSKHNIRLTEIVESRLAETQSITSKETEAWFQEHIARREQSLVMSVKADLIKIIHEVFGDLSNAGENMSLFSKNLVQYSKRIEAAEDKETFQETLKGLLMEVKNAGEVSVGLRLRLKKADEEVKVLQSKLREVEQHATTDPLTSLYNRRTFEEKLTHHMSQSTKTNSELSLLIIDIDHFKRINDTYGHLTGDDLLRIIAKTIKDFVKGKDIVCRYGGEEFVVLLPDTPLSGAVTVAENIRRHFAQMSWRQKSTGVSMGKVTLSAGASLFKPGETMEAFVQRADVALYHSKKTGRNLVTAEKQ